MKSAADLPVLALGIPEPWATEWGEDEYGPFVGFSVECVVQRLRFIPAGRFVMGSPASEAGRSEGEGPQHEVELSRGFWLADAPVTQALWQAVMGNNPSRYVSPERPVEQVSWDDCQAFIARLSERVPGLDPRLPTEAEWEYACRAGTGTATWKGDLEILGAHNAPILDEIAWYGGNSGEDFKLDNGWDSTKWPEKQYPHRQAGTHLAKNRAANPYGLYDMLGNVWEWCEDWFGPYSGTLARDPRGPAKGSRRALRGGSWGSFASDVRAAYRHANAPDYRYVNLGFRLARGQGR